VVNCITTENLPEKFLGLAPQGTARTSWCHCGYRRFRPLITTGTVPAVTTGRSQLDNGVSIPSYFAGAAGIINVVIDDPAHGESAETGNSTGVTDGNLTSGASQFAPTAILGNDIHLFFGGKPWNSQLSGGFCVFSRRSSTTGIIISAVDFHPISGAPTVESFDKAVFVKRHTLFVHRQTIEITASRLFQLIFLDIVENR